MILIIFLLDLFLNKFYESLIILNYIYFTKRNYIKSFCIGLLYGIIYSELPIIYAIAFLCVTILYVNINNKYIFLISLILYKTLIEKHFFNIHVFFLTINYIDFNMYKFVLSIIYFTILNIITHIIIKKIIKNK